ncbi:hypothetical protein DSO57_1032352 [Entomophthora muscae]|uniref:Uncharacterized protein n=1 Tax=Entomophthora muscae TaxID=34485 RepID=A0ACC2TB67_9FUNG|nr:hypothetical protein DSO57_1032352 [Entomophthora muscae]
MAEPFFPHSLNHHTKVHFRTTDPSCGPVPPWLETLKISGAKALWNVLIPDSSSTSPSRNQRIDPEYRTLLSLFSSSSINSFMELLGGYQGGSWTKARDQLDWDDILSDTGSMEKIDVSPLMISKGGIGIESVFINAEGIPLKPLW